MDVSRKDKDGKHPPCGRSKAKKGSKGYPKCRPSVKVSSKTPKTSGSMSEGQKRAATKRKRSKKQGVGGKPTIVKQVAVEPELSMVDFSTEEHPFMPPMYPCEHRLSGCQGVTEVSGPSDLRYPNDNWITACRPCYDKITRGYDGGLSEPMIATGEPMDIPMRLLKEQIDYENQMELAPHEQLWNDEADEHLKTKTNELFDYAIAQGIDPGDLLDAWHDRASMVEGLDYGEPGSELGFRAHAVDPSQWKKLASEPMDIAFQLLKTPVSPEAKRHKLEYDKQYESNPKRVKYREELNRERRKRGIYGHGGPDMSHTKDHTLVAESPHANRARHFKERGTLKSEVVLVKVRL